MNPSSQSLSQLEAARNLALGDGRYYPTIIPGVLPIIGANANATPEVQRWGAEFLAETFASPAWPSDVKEASAVTVLATLKEYLNADDTGIVKHAVQAAASMYPLVYRHIVSDPSDGQNWQVMLAIKTNILRRMDAAPPGIRICCVKFVQQVVLAQTPGMVADPRRPEHNDISLALVPREHPLIPYANLEAEASGLLDRLLDIIHGEHRLDRLAMENGTHLTGDSDALLVTAALNVLGTLIQRRPIIANKILNSILNFNPLKLANSPMTPRNKVIIKSMERTTRALLVNVIKRNPEGNFNPKIQQYLERMHRMRFEAFDETNRKRPAPVEPTAGLDQAKRQRLGAAVPDPTPIIAPLPPGPVSYRQLYTIDPDSSTASFDVTVFQDLNQLIQILIPILASIDETKLGTAINVVRSRYLDLCNDAARANASQNAIVPAIDDEEEYEPDFEPEDAEQVVNRLDSAPADILAPEPAPAAPLAPYKLPEAPPLTDQEVQRYGGMTIHRILGMMAAVEDADSKKSVKLKGTKGGFNRLAATSYDRDSWMTIFARLATRAPVGLDEHEDNGIKSEFGQINKKKGTVSLSDAVRDAIYDYIIHAFRSRIDVAISWLSEEWYNDRIQATTATSNTNGVSNGQGGTHTTTIRPKGNYQRCALRLIDGLLPYIENTDKVLIRFMSELPEIDASILQRILKLAEDPERIDLSVKILQYLHMFRPPVRELCVDVLEEMWRTNVQAKPASKKLLAKWRPAALESEENEIKAKTGADLGMTNGSLEVQPVA